MMSHAPLHLLGPIAATIGRSTVPLLVPLWFAIGITVAILFGPSGMQASDAVHVLHQSTPARATLWMAWTALMAPIFARAITSPGTSALRSAPVSTTTWTLLLSLWLVALQLPFALLFLAGEGPVAGLATALLAAAAQTSLVSRHRTSAWVVAATCTATILIDPPSPMLAVIGAITCAVGVRQAWLFAPEQSRRSAGPRLRLPPILALVHLHLLTLARCESIRLTRAVAFMLAGAAACRLSLANNPPDPQLATFRVVSIEVIPAVLALAALAGPITDCHNRIRWLPRTTGHSDTSARVAATASMVLCAAPLGIIYGLVSVAGAASFTATIHTLLASTLWACGIGVLVLGRAATHETRSRQDKGRLAAAYLLVAVAGVAVALVQSHAVAIVASIVATVHTLRSRWSEV